jgi:hypothetical protein
MREKRMESREDLGKVRWIIKEGQDGDETHQRTAKKVNAIM